MGRTASLRPGPRGLASGGEAAPARGVGPGPARALARRTFGDARIRTLSFAYLFAIYAYIQPFGYRRAYPTAAGRLAFATSFANNKGLRLFYGEPHDVATVAGYTAWRVGGTLAIAAAIYGLLAAVRALRAEEDAGRAELVLAGPLGRGSAFAAQLVAVALGVALLWAAELAGFAVAGLPLGGSAYLALATATVAAVYVGIGAVVSQLAPNRRLALELGGAIVAAGLLLRAVADTSGGAGWLRWLTPLGWAEELRPFGGAEPLVLLLPAAATVALLLAAAALAARRDLGSGLLRARDTAAPRLYLLSSPTAQALRGERDGLIAWTLGIGVFAFILGVISQSVSSAGISESIQRQIAKLGAGSILTPSGYIGFVFLFFILALSLFSCAQVGAARREESEQQLETLLALPVGRTGWLGGRLALAALAAAALSLVAGVCTWAGAAAVSVHVPFVRMVEAGANCLPVALCFLGLAALAYALTPRASAAVAYGLVTVAFLWQTVGALVGAPRWLVDLTPFAHVGLLPAESFRAGAAAVLVAVGVVAALGALLGFRRRDLEGA
jgi:ABC-2 type transport system permease protein